MSVRKVLLALPLAVGLAVAVAPAAHAVVPVVDKCEQPVNPLLADHEYDFELGTTGLCVYQLP